MSNRITLAMIVKPDTDEAKKLRRALTSVMGRFDEIVITQAGKERSKEVEEVCADFGAKVDFFEWVDDFAAARNHNFAQATGDWIMWLDADDILVGGDKLEQYLALANDKNIDGFGLLYHYGYDDNGNLTEKHWKTQIIRNDGHAEWKGAIHEDLIPKRAANWTKIHDIIRVHKSSREENASHFERNLRILEAEQVKNPEEPRTYFYLARTYLGLGRFVECVNACVSYLERSGWDQERYEARLIMGEAFTKLGDTDAALDAYQSAILEYESAPDAYVYKARIYATQERWRDALTNLEIAGSLTGKGVVENPTLMQKDVPLLAALCLLNLKRFDEAAKLARVAMKTRSPEAVELHQTASKLAEWESLTRTYVELGRHLADTNLQALRSLIESVPADIADDPRIVQLRFTAFPPTVWQYKSIAFYCGLSLEPWDGTATKTKGIGGSETAVIELAKQFAANGWKAVVYNWCDAPPEGMEIDGVLYKNYWQIDHRDTFDVLVLWRTPGFLDIDWKARKLIVDMHDVSNPNEWTPKRLEKVDHVFVKSEYHKSLYPTVPEKKFVVVGNGIDLRRFEGQATKNPNRFVYTSTPNRGLEHVLDVWPEIKKEIPDAELHVYYGWTSFYESHKREPVMMEWMRSMQAKMEQPGIVNHGRVSQTELARDLMASSLWLYPTEFPEIHCITALEMQAAGVYPITTGFAALAETQQSGVKLPGDPKDAEWRKQFVAEVVKAYKDQAWEAADGKEWAAKCSWDNVASVWIETLK